MKFILIDANGAGETGRAIVEWVPASVRSICGVLEKYNIDYEVALVEDFSPEIHAGDCYLITGMSSDLPMMRRAASSINDEPLIVGGPATFDPLGVFDVLDPSIAVIGEGEKTLSLLLENGLKRGDLPEETYLSALEGIAYKTDENGIQIQYPKGYLSKEELGGYFPSVRVVKYYPFIEHIGVVVEPLRGCSNFSRPGKYHGKICPSGCKNCKGRDLSARMKCPLGTPAGCGFCSVAGLYGPPRSRSQESIVKEIKGLIRHGARRISFLVPDPLDYKREELVAPEPLTDPTFPEPNYVELERLCEMIWNIPEVESGEVLITIRDVKATMVTPRSAWIIKEYFPTSIVGLGCESGSERHSMELGRGYSPSEVIRAVSVLNEVGIKPKVNLIAGLPGQTEESVRETIEFMRALRGKVLYFDLARFESLPMSAFDDYPSDYGPIKDEATRRLFAEGASTQKELFESFVGQKWRVAIGVYKQQSIGEDHRERTPKRKFRQLAGVVGYPIFQKEHLSLIATVVKILNPPSGLKNGDVREVVITGASEVGFRVVIEGRIV